MWKVLIVDDERLVRKYVRKLVEENAPAFQVVGECEDGETALDVICQEKPDLIISDIVMPRLNGIELLKQVRALKIESRFLMLTCMNEFEYARQAVENGASNYILKLSMNETTLIPALDKIREQFEEQQANQQLLKRAAQYLGGAEVETELPTDHAEINKIIAHIKQHFKQEITLHSMAEYVRMDQSYLSTLFKRKTGATLTDYLHKYRVEQAQGYLKNTSLTVGEIAQRVGFVNDNYFIKIFKRWANQTPKEYRKACR